MIALISGRGDYPKEITSSLKNQKINFIKLNLYQKDKYNVSIGEIGKIISMESYFGNNLLTKKNWFGFTKKKRLTQKKEFLIKKWVVDQY